MVYLDNNDSILKCKDDDEKYIYYCVDCKKNICAKCCLNCEGHNLIDLNRDIKTKIRRNYIKSKLKERYEYYMKNKIDDISDNFYDNNDNFNLLSKEKFKFVPDDKDKNIMNKIKIETNDSFTEKIQEDCEKKLLFIIDIIINDYDNYPNYNHIENILYLEKYLYCRYGRKDGEKPNIMKLEYKKQNINKIDIFGKIFVENNKDNCFLKINNHLIELTDEIN